MIKYFLMIFILLFPQIIFAEEGISIALETPNINIHDKESIKRGAKFFSTNCMVCHTLIYMRYNTIAQNGGVLYNKMPINVKSWPLDVTPPDLSLEVSRRGISWVYTYLHSFYIDPSRPTGVNNLILPNTAMSGILMPYQGKQIKVPITQGKLIYGRYQWYDLVELQTQGTLTPAQFDQTIKDVVNFLAYASEPYKIEQQRIGWWVIGFFVVMFVLVYLLKQNYWKSVKRRNYR